MKYKWKVEPNPVGRYSSFEKRGFPHAYYENGEIAAYIDSEIKLEEYVPKKVEYESLILRVADHSQKPWKWKILVKRYKTIQECKDAFERVLRQHPEYIPKSKESLPSSIFG